MDKKAAKPADARTVADAVGDLVAPTPAAAEQLTALGIRGPGVRFLGSFDTTDPDSPVPLHFISGVPARDLLPEEWYALSEETQALCLTTKLYELTGQIAPVKEE